MRPSSHMTNFVVENRVAVACGFANRRGVAWTRGLVPHAWRMRGGVGDYDKSAHGRRPISKKRSPYRLV